MLHISICTYVCEDAEVEGVSFIKIVVDDGDSMFCFVRKAIICVHYVSSCIMSVFVYSEIMSYSPPFCCRCSLCLIWLWLLPWSILLRLLYSQSTLSSSPLMLGFMMYIYVKITKLLENNSCCMLTYQGPLLPILQCWGSIICKLLPQICTCTVAKSPLITTRPQAAGHLATDSMWHIIVNLIVDVWLAWAAVTFPFCLLILLQRVLALSVYTFNKQLCCSWDEVVGLISVFFLQFHHIQRYMQSSFDLLPGSPLFTCNTG